MVKSVVPVTSKHILIEKQGEDPTRDSRSIRLEVLKDTPDGLWLDADSVLRKWFDFDFEPGFPYVLRNTCYASAIYCNGCQKLISEIYEEQKQTKKCPCGLIKKRIKEFKFFPEGYIEHFSVGQHIKSKKDNYKTSNTNYSIIKKAGVLSFELYNK